MRRVDCFPRTGNAWLIAAAIGVIGRIHHWCYFLIVVPSPGMYPARHFQLIPHPEMLCPPGMAAGQARCNEDREAYILLTERWKVCYDS